MNGAVEDGKVLVLIVSAKVVSQVAERDLAAPRQASRQRGRHEVAVQSGPGADAFAFLVL